MIKKHPLIGYKQTKEHIANKVKVLKGKKRTAEQKQRMSDGAKGRKLSAESIAKRTATRQNNGWNKDPEATKLKQSLNNARANKGKTQSIESNLKRSEALKGEKNHNWKGGVYQVNNRIRKSLKYRLWRQDVFKKDNYTCQVCNMRGGELQADHIKPFALHPELRFKLDNGRTLCVKCHRKTETWGYSKMYRI